MWIAFAWCRGRLGMFHGNGAKPIDRRDDGTDLLPRLVHDLRNPLGVMLSFAEMIPSSDEAERAQFCARLAANAQRALHVLEDYALLGDLRAGRVELEVAQAAWLPLVGAAVEDARADSGVASAIERRGTTSAVVHADGVRLHCALRCLMREMVHALGGAGIVSVAVGGDAAQAIAEIAAEFHPGVPAFSLLDANSLAAELARAVVDLHGGSLEIRTAAGSQAVRMRLASIGGLGTRG